MNNATLTSDSPEIAKILVKHGTVVNGTGALEFAAWFGRLRMARYPLGAGAEINKVRPRDST